MLTEHVINGKLNGLTSCNQPLKLASGECREQHVLASAHRWLYEETGDFFRSRTVTGHLMY